MSRKSDSVLSLPWGVAIRILIGIVTLAVLVMGGWTALELRASAGLTRVEAYETFVPKEQYQHDQGRIEDELREIGTDVKQTREAVIRMEAKLE